MDVYWTPSTGGSLPVRGGGGVQDRFAWRDQRLGCGNPACTKGWLRLLKDRRRPVFEHQWGCSTDCIESLVSVAVRREFGDGNIVDDGREHRHRIPLGLVMLSQGWITHPQLQRALMAQKRSGRGRIGSWLVAECGVKQEHVTRALSMQWSCPVLTSDGFDPRAMALLVPRLLIERLGMVPLRIAGDRILYLAFEDRLDASAALALERMSGLKVESGLADGLQLKYAQQRLYQSDFVSARYEQVADMASLTRKMAYSLDKLQPRSSQLVRIHQFYWLRMWLETGAMSTRDGGVPASREDVVDRIYSVGFEQ
jgi:hypothetical protein